MQFGLLVIMLTFRVYGAENSMMTDAPHLSILLP